MIEELFQAIKKRECVFGVAQLLKGAPNSAPVETGSTITRA